jgi:hypothetical protein
MYYKNGSHDAKILFEHQPVVSKMEIYKPTTFLKYSEKIVAPFFHNHTKKKDKKKYKRKKNSFDPN